MPQTWQRAALAAYVMATLAVGGWAINDRSAVELRLLSHQREIAEVRLVAERGVAEVRLSSTTGNAQVAQSLVDIQRRLGSIESKVDALK